MAEVDDIMITHFKGPRDRLRATTPLLEMEPFVRALAAWRDNQDNAWENFQHAARRVTNDEEHMAIADREGTAFLTWTLHEANLTNHLILGDGYETPALGGEGYSSVQRALRRLTIPRLEDFETKIFNEVLEALKQRLAEHSYGCYAIRSDNVIQYVMIIKDPATFEEIAHTAGIDLITSWDY